MLPRAHWLRQRSAFEQIYRHGSRYRGKFVTVRCLQVRASPSAMPEGVTWVERDSVSVGRDRKVVDRSAELRSACPLLPMQIAVVVSKKVHRRAVVRNRIKRRIRAQLQPLLPRLQPGWQVIVVPHRPVAAEADPPLLLATSRALQHELSQLFERAGALGPSPSSRESIAEM